MRGVRTFVPLLYFTELGEKKRAKAGDLVFDLHPRTMKKNFLVDSGKAEWVELTDEEYKAFLTQGNPGEPVATEPAVIESAVIESVMVEPAAVVEEAVVEEAPVPGESDKDGD